MKTCTLRGGVAVAALLLAACGPTASRPPDGGPPTPPPDLVGQPPDLAPACLQRGAVSGVKTPPCCPPLVSSGGRCCLRLLGDTLLCDAPQEAGEPCRIPEECRTGLCVRGQCAAPLPAGASCLEDRECASGRCDARLPPDWVGTCGIARVGPGMPCTPGANECVARAACEPVSTGGYRCACVAPAVPCWDACPVLDTDPLHCGACGAACGPGETCAGGRCEATVIAPSLLPPGEPCGADAECASGECGRDGRNPVCWPVLTGDPFCSPPRRACAVDGECCFSTVGSLEWPAACDAGECSSVRCGACREHGDCAGWSAADPSPRLTCVAGRCADSRIPCPSS